MEIKHSICEFLEKAKIMFYKMIHEFIQRKYFFLTIKQEWFLGLKRVNQTMNFTNLFSFQKQNDILSFKFDKVYQIQ